MRSFWSDVQDDPFVCLQRPRPLSLLCPRCFGDDPKPEIGFVSVDGNFQHKRFPTCRIGDDTYLEDQDRRLFISTNYTEVTPVNIELAKYVKMPSDDSDSGIKQTPCGRHFKATAGKDVSNQVVDTGVMAILCRCESHYVFTMSEEPGKGLSMLSDFLKVSCHMRAARPR